MSNMHHCSYGTLKKIGEHYTKYLNGIVVQLWNTFGYEEIGFKSHVVTDFIDMALKDSHISLRTDGSETRQFLYDKDLPKEYNTVVCKNSWKSRNFRNRNIRTFTGKNESNPHVGFM